MTTSGLEALLERVENVTGPNFALEQEIMWTLENIPVHMRSPNDKPHPYTCSVDAALALVERVLPKSDVSLFKRIDGWNSFVKNLLTHEAFAPETKRPNGALAILCALLRALIAQEKANG